MGLDPCPLDPWTVVESPELSSPLIDGSDVSFLGPDISGSKNAMFVIQQQRLV